MTSFSALGQLVAGYLNQDWTLDYEVVWAAVEDFAKAEPPGLVAEARCQALQLLHAEATEEGLRRVLVDELYSGYWPHGDGLTFRSWLESVAEALPSRA